MKIIGLIIVKITIITSSKMMFKTLDDEQERSYRQLNFVKFISSSFDRRNLSTVKTLADRHQLSPASERVLGQGPHRHCSV